MTVGLPQCYRKTVERTVVGAEISARELEGQYCSRNVLFSSLSLQYSVNARILMMEDSIQLLRGSIQLQMNCKALSDDSSLAKAIQNFDRFLF